MKISVVTDEISADLETAVELAAEWGVRDFQLRGFGTQRVPFFTNFQRQRVRELLDEYDARIVAISPGLFKIPYSSKKREHFPLQVIDSALFQKWHDARSLVDFHMQELLPASLEYAKELGADQVIIFSFNRGSNPAAPAPDEVLEILHAAADQAQASGSKLPVEVEDQFWADTGRRTADMIRAIDHPALGVNWDPGNAIAAGDFPYPDGYNAVRDYVQHVHFKDVIRTTGGDCCYAVNGQINWAGQIQSLAAYGYSGYISVEPHMQPKIVSARASYLRLKALMESISERVAN